MLEIVKAIRSLKVNHSFPTYTNLTSSAGCHTASRRTSLLPKTPALVWHRRAPARARGRGTLGAREQRRLCLCFGAHFRREQFERRRSFARTAVGRVCTCGGHVEGGYGARGDAESSGDDEGIGATCCVRCREETKKFKFLKCFFLSFLFFVCLVS